MSTVLIGWIVCAVVFAALFSLMKTIDRLTYSVELLHARLDRMSAGLAETVVSLDALAAHGGTATLDGRANRLIEHSAGQ